MTMKPGLLLVLATSTLLTVPFTISQSATLSERVTQDTYLRDDGVSGPQNGDSDNELLAGFNGGGDLRTLLAFDVSAITDAVNTTGGGNFSNLTISSATLTIFERRSAVGSLGTIDVLSYNFGFVDTVSVWDDPDGDESLATGDTTNGGSTSGTLLADDYSINWGTSGNDNDSSAISLSNSGLVTAIENSSSLGDLSFIFDTIGYGNTSFHSITSDRSANSSRHALLDITYSVAAVPEPSSFALIAGCLALTSIMLRRR